MEQIRTFIAVELPEEVKRHLEEVQRQLRGPGDLPVKWVSPRGIHLTLKFLGNVPASSVDDIARAVAAESVKTAPFELKLGAAGAFPNLRSPRVVWVGLAGNTSPLLDLQKEIERCVVPLGFAPENRPFSPHLTVGRVREGALPEDRRRLGEAVCRLAVVSDVPFRVDSVSLMKSTLAPTGAVYECLSSSELGGR